MSADDTVGEFRISGSPQVVAVALGALGAMGVMLLVSAALSPDLREAFLPLGALVFLLSIGTAYALRTVRIRAEHTLPQGDARRDPFAWMNHVAHLRGASWKGPVEGRRVEIQTLPRRNGPSSLRISVATAARTRLAWTRRPPLGKAVDAAAGLESVDGAASGFKGLELTIADRTWARRLFKSRVVKRSVERLTDDEPVVLVVLRPGRLLVQYAYGSNRTIDAARLQDWTAALLALAEEIEANGDPAQPLEPNAVERLMDRNLS